MKKLTVLFGIGCILFLSGCGRLSNKHVSMPSQPPSEIAAFSSEVAYEDQLTGFGVAVRLNWNIENQDIQGVVIRKSTVGFPNSVTEGDIVVEANRDINSFTDQGVSVNTTYYYSLWTYNSDDQYSESFITSSVHTSEPENDAVFVMSSSHTPGILSEQNVVEISWYSYSLSGIAGYSFVWSSAEDTEPNNEINTTQNSTTSSPLDDGVWYFHIKAKNNAGSWGDALHYGPFYINSGSLDLPTVTIVNSNPGASESELDWSSKNIISLSWTTNLEDEDVSGYSYQFSVHSNTEPDDSSEGTLKSINSDQLQDGVWYFHIKAQNSLDQWGGTTHYGPFRIDSSKPATPEIQENISFVNINPPVDEWTVQNIAELTWEYVGDSGATGYSYVWDKFESTIPDTVSEGTGTSATSPALTDGAWYFHIRARNSKSQWSQAVHCGPFLIDSASPQPISDLTFLPSDGAITFRWERPDDADLAGTIVVRKDYSFPTSIDDGLIIHNAWSRNLVDTGLENNKDYYYSFWAVDIAGNLSDPVNLVAQAYNSNADDDELVASVTEGDQRNSRIARFNDGSFVVLYLNKAEDGGIEYEELYAEVYDHNANKTVEGIKLPLDQEIGSDYSVSALKNNNFVVVWSVNDMDVYAQIFDKSGNTVLGAYRVNSIATYEQRRPDVAGLANGNFVIVWQAGEKGNDGPDGDRRGIQAKVFYSNGQVKSDEFTVNQWTFKHQQRPSVASYSGGFVVAWESRKKDGVDEDLHGYGIAARKFSSNGVAIGNEFLVNITMKDKDQGWVKVASLANLGFVIAWQSGDNDAPPAFYHGIYARMYDSKGDALGSDFLVKSFLSDPLIPIDEDNELDPNMISIAGLTDGGFVVAFDNMNGYDKDGFGFGDGYGVFAKRYSSFGNQVGLEEQINSYCLGDQKEPQVIGLNNGEYFVIWESKGQNEGINDSGVYGRKL